MRVLVIGAGALGSLFAARLAAGGHDVLLLGRSPDHAEVISRHGLVIRYPSSGKEEVVRFPATAEDQARPCADLIIFLTKSQDTEAAAARAARHAGPGTVLLSLQNGIGNLERICREMPGAAALAGVTAVGSRLVAAGRIEVTEGVEFGTAVSSLGPWLETCSVTTAQRVAHLLGACGLRSEPFADIQPLIWTKLAMACAMNAVASIARVGVGAIMRAEPGRNLIACVVDEIAAIAIAKGIALDPAALRETCFTTYEGCLTHVPSMATDVLEGRRTEVGALNEAVVREAAAQGLEAPVNRTLARLVRLIEGSYSDLLAPGGR